MAVFLCVLQRSGVRVSACQKLNVISPLVGHVGPSSIRLGLGYGPSSSGSATVWLDSSVVDPALGHASGGASELPLRWITSRAVPESDGYTISIRLGRIRYTKSYTI